VDGFKKNILFNFYKQMSGHPRSIEHLVEAFRDDSRWTRVFDALRDTNSTSALLVALLRSWKLGTFSVSNLLDSGLEKFIFSLNEFEPVDPDLRKLMEEGSVFIVSTDGLENFVTATQGLSVLQLIVNPQMWKSAKGFVCKQAQELFKGLVNPKCPVSTWWERLVDLTIVSHSSREMLLADVFNLTTVSDDMQFTCPQLEVVREHWDVNQRVEKENSLEVPHSRTEPGYDSRVILSHEDLRFGIYNQSKIQTPNNVGVAYSNSIIYSVIDGVKRGLNVSEIHVVVYNWGIATAAAAASSTRKADVKARLDVLEAKPSESEFSCVSNFIDGFLASNFHVISREEMKRWLVPSLVTIPDAILAFTE
jgi:hypothetical protein